MQQNRQVGVNSEAAFDNVGNEGFGVNGDITIMIIRPSYLS
jgi:hypothetical protein